MSLRIAVDTGGTFTDVVVTDAAGGELWVSKAPTTGGPTLVLLHEGLGSVGLWRGFPSALAAATGGRTIAFSRYGHGRSDPPANARTPRFMQEEALDVLPSVLREVGAVERCWSGTATVPRSRSSTRLSIRWRGVVAMAPHVFVEEMCLSEIHRAREAYAAEGLRARIARHHRDPDAAFYGWNDVWLDPEFRAWDITEAGGPDRVPAVADSGRA